ncbi:hypothetical protein MVLG_05571 [Microbotryum lychnidis-dioicae p1A1 Lamole]|uniref:Ubiquitin carboxyl-terminal hydrolase n=1 Tax=Microbotryum lychnidis-dioicae (strain p1A1 Lamole / MvSl-1064) TaxID=683840 RepID=U5HEM8_USTV1|nr:hypothetical protein MVLG_05571 [Microbotryum lychnidis-dioicae p1A1 Lamole]|eukprot:KDE04002.1 hypothetical protein MVLG_05571 [Microbotryum lychnidis-dioicae p1A1 Lamole]
MASKERQRWLPLEFTAESFNTWSHSASTRPLQDCYGLDAEVLGWVKQPFKVEWRRTSIYSPTRGRRSLEEDGVEHVADIIYFKQTIANACGTFGLLHALANAGVPLEPGYLTKLFEQCKDKTPLERAQLLTARPTSSSGCTSKLLRAVKRLQDTAVRVKEIIELSNSLEFSLITLNPTPED